MRKLARKNTTPKKAEMKLKVNSKNATDAKTAGTVKNQVRGKHQRVDTVAFALEGLRARSGEQSRDLQGLSSVPSAETPSALVPAVDPANLKNVWAMQNDSQARDPGQENAISIDLYNLNNAHKSPLWRCDELPLPHSFLAST